MVITLRTTSKIIMINAVELEKEKKKVRRLAKYIKILCNWFKNFPYDIINQFHNNTETGFNSYLYPK